MTQLPYSFDLLWDFKTVKQLHDHLTGRQRYATSATDFELITLAQELNVPLPEGINVSAPFAVAMRTAEARVPETATHYLIAGSMQAPQGITTLHLQFFRLKTPPDSVVWEQFCTDADDEYPEWSTAARYWRDGVFDERVVPKLLPLEGNK